MNLMKNYVDYFFKYLCHIEIKLRSSISYYFCQKHGERQEEYLNPNNYSTSPKSKRGVIKLIKILDNVANKNKDHKYLVYQRNKYHNVPLWVILNALTFGQISKIFEFLPQKCKDSFARSLEISRKMT